MQSSRKFKNGDKVYRVDNPNIKLVVVYNEYRIGNGTFNHCRDERNDAFIFEDKELELDKATIVHDILKEI